jgi:hypothetical protein
MPEPVLPLCYVPLSLPSSWCTCYKYRLSNAYNIPFPPLLVYRPSSSTPNTLTLHSLLPLLSRFCISARAVPFAAPLLPPISSCSFAFALSVKMHFKTASLVTAAGLFAAASSPAVQASPIGDLVPRGVINNLMNGAAALLTEYTSATLPLITTTSATVYDAQGTKYQVSRTNSTLRRGIPWAGDDSVLPKIATASLVSWMHHWENPKPETLP